MKCNNVCPFPCFIHVFEDFLSDSDISMNTEIYVSTVLGLGSMSGDLMKIRNWTITFNNLFPHEQIDGYSNHGCVTDINSHRWHTSISLHSTLQKGWSPVPRRAKVLKHKHFISVPFRWF